MCNYVFTLKVTLKASYKQILVLKYMDLHLNIFFLLKPLDDVKPSETVAIAEDGAGTTSFGIVNHFFSFFSLWSFVLFAGFLA